MNFSDNNNSRIFDNYRQAQEFEKKRIANELHDTSLQTLTYLINKLEVVSLYLDKDIDSARDELNKSKEVLKSVVDEMRNTIFNLRPMSFDDLSLREALEQYILSCDEKSEIFYHYDICDIDIDDEYYMLELFRCIQECINNSEKHSKAKNIYLDIKCNDFICIDIRDDGIGFDVNAVCTSTNPHFGLKIIRDRVEMMGGSISIESDNNGVSIKIIIPFSK